MPPCVGTAPIQSEFCVASQALKVLTGLDKPAKYADIYYTLCPTLMFHLPRVSQRTRPQFA